MPQQFLCLSALPINPTSRPTAVPSKIRLDEMNLDFDKLKGKLRYWAEKSMEIDLDNGDADDEDTFNRILWYATRGVDEPYPEEYAGKKE